MTRSWPDRRAPRCGMAGRIMAVAFGLLLALAPMGAVAQTVVKTDATVTLKKGATGQSEVDYKAWEKTAAEVEAKLSAPDTTDADLDALRKTVVDWRATFQTAQATNADRIATLRDQIAALGPAPAEGETEAPEIATRRTELSDQLSRLQAPGLAADEAYRRADGLIGEIDRVTRDRQANQLMQLWPMPVNPANWPSGLVALKDAALTLWTESETRWQAEEPRKQLFDNLPLIIALGLFGTGLLWRGRALVRRVTGARMVQGRGLRSRRLLELVISLGQVILPTAGVLALATGLQKTGMAGPFGASLLQVLGMIGFTVFTANWLGACVFPVADDARAAFRLTPDKRAMGRFLTASIGWLLGLETLRQDVVSHLDMDLAAKSVLSFPLIVTMGVLLVRTGQLLHRHVAAQAEGEDGRGFDDRVLDILARGVIAIGALGPVLAAVGYIAAAEAMVYPAAISLGLVALIYVLQRFVSDIYGLITRSDVTDQDGLVPVLIGFAMVTASLPVFALIWGARTSDITELWQRFLGGFQIGQTRVSPMDFLLFAIVFAAGYAVTRLVQGALKGTLLPRTNLDQGGQNAIVSGVGYIGVFLAALLAINFAGIDLSGLAIVAGALSVGIGFGLQNIVSNFVSGIILLIERPVSEGDWIEVGGVQGTVQAISVRSTRIQTFDRTDVIVPNADLVSGQVKNWTRFNLLGRLIVPVGVAYGSDTRKVERILREIAEAQPLAVMTPPPVIVLMGFGADSIDFEIRLILRDVNFSLSVRSDINHEIVRRFAEEQIEIPYAQRDITLRNVDAIGRAIRGVPAVAEVAATKSAEQPAPATKDTPKDPPDGSY
jgi:potassium-dependent mechanosensitive channel